MFIRSEINLKREKDAEEKEEDSVSTNSQALKLEEREQRDR